MNLNEIKLSRTEARRLYRDYKSHVHYSTPIDDEIRRTYQLIAQGRVVIRALEAIKAAGLYADGPNVGRPKLAICRADRQKCQLVLETNGGATFTADHHYRANRERTLRIEIPAGTFPRRESEIGGWAGVEAQVPLVPVHLRPKRGLANYHVLWEAEWTRIPAVDPVLLRRIGRGDMWLVVAAWDLTEVERAALSTRMSS